MSSEFSQLWRGRLSRGLLEVVEKGAGGCATGRRSRGRGCAWAGDERGTTKVTVKSRVGTKRGIDCFLKNQSIRKNTGIYIYVYIYMYIYIHDIYIYIYIWYIQIHAYIYIICICITWVGKFEIIRFEHWKTLDIFISETEKRTNQTVALAGDVLVTGQEIDQSKWRVQTCARSEVHLDGSSSRRTTGHRRLVEAFLEKWNRNIEKVEDFVSRPESFFVDAPAGIAVQSATFCPQCCKRQRVQRNGRGKGHKVWRNLAHFNEAFLFTRFSFLLLHFFVCSFKFGPWSGSTVGGSVHPGVNKNKCPQQSQWKGFSI